MTKPAAHSLPPAVDVDDAMRRVREHGGRVTAGKRALAELLFEGRRSMTVDEISVVLHDHDRSAIYRNLAQFEELGIAEHVHLGHGQAVYRPAGLATVPVLCSTCGADFEFDRSRTAAFARQVEKHTGVVLDLTHFPLTGACRACVELEHSSAPPA